MDQNLNDVLSRLDEIERELDDIKKRLLAVSHGEAEVKEAVKGYLSLRDSVSKRWVGRPSVLEELRKSRGHE
jgi:hypothetical protein